MSHKTLKMGHCSPQKCAIGSVRLSRMYTPGITFHYLRYPLLPLSNIVSCLRLSMKKAWMGHILGEFSQIWDDRSQINMALS